MRVYTVPAVNVVAAVEPPSRTPEVVCAASTVGPAPCLIATVNWSAESWREDRDLTSVSVGAGAALV